MRYLRTYWPVVLAASMVIVVVLAAPALVTTLAGVSGRTLSHKDVALATLVTRALLVLIGAVACAFLALVRRGAISEAELWEDQDEGAIELYRGLTRDAGVAPGVVRQVIDSTSRLAEDERGADFERANIPNFAAELGYRLGINSETREMMREFFQTNRDDDTKRSFSTSTRVTMEGGRIEHTQGTKAEVEPVARFAPVDPDSDPNWTGEVTDEDLRRKLFLGWDDHMTADDDGQAGSLAADYTEDWITDRGQVPCDAHNGGAPVRPDVGTQSDDALAPSHVDDDDQDHDGNGWRDYIASDEELATDIVETVSDATGEDDTDSDYAHSLFGSEGEDEFEAADDVAQPEVPDGAFEIPSGELETDEEEAGWTISAMVQHDPVIAGLVNSLDLTRRLPGGGGIRHLYSFYGSAVPDLVAVFANPITRHSSAMSADIEPFFNYAGVRRFTTDAWTLHLEDKTIRDDDLDATVWIPVGIATMGGEDERRAWKLVPVQAGMNATFYALRQHFPLVAARLDWILGNLHEDLQVTDDEAQGVTSFYIPSLSVTVDLMESAEESHGDFDIRGDFDDAGGPEELEILSLSFLSDGAHDFFASRLGADQLGHDNWVALFSLAVTLCLKDEPVSTKELLGRWAESGTVRGKELIEMIQTAFDGHLGRDGDEWALANVRVDVFWVDERLSDPGEASTQVLKRFFEKNFDPGNLDFLLNRGSLDPRARSGDEIAMDRVLRRVLRDAAETLSPGAEGTLADNLSAITQALERS